MWNSYKTDISNGYIGLQNFFLPYNKKKKKIKNQIMNGGIKSPPFIDFFEYFGELKKILGTNCA